MTGVVKRVIQEKRFGFIIGDGRMEYFFHKEDYDGSWEALVADCNSENKVAVEFEAGKTDRGLRARSVRRRF
jgi:cold shock CspA family protein